MATEGDPIRLYIVAMLTSFEAVADAESATTAASAAAWPSGKRSLPLTKVGLCHTKPSFIGGGTMSLSFVQYSAPWGRA